MKVIVPFAPARAGEPEPEAEIRYGGVTIRLGLTYLHHLVTCQGWGDRESSFFQADRVMGNAMNEIQREMWAQIDRKRVTADNLTDAQIRSEFHSTHDMSTSRDCLVALGLDVYDGDEGIPEARSRVAAAINLRKRAK